MNISHAEERYTTRDALLAAFLVLIAALFSFGPIVQKRLTSKAAEGVFTLKDVVRHDEAGDCWLIVDGYVFDLSGESRKHPSLFSCGQDGSANYHKNHGPTIRERMMRFKIGELDEASKARLTEAGSVGEGIADTEIKPRTELFVEKGSWDPLDLMIVMERENRSLLAIDGKTHKAVGRVSDIGNRVHTQVFSPDGLYAYHIGRDGWLTKIDLRSLEPVAHVRVGTDSRGTAITQSGTYVAVGNYEPRDVVILDAETLAIVARVPLFDTAESPVSSRAGGLADVGEKFIVSLKDARSVWVIDTAQRGMPVTHRFWDIGEKGDVLHDAFLAGGGRYFITAVQGSDHVWALDTRDMKEVAEVKTGKTPHTGPGAEWGDLVFIPSLGEAILTAIDMRSWTVRARIPTGGAGLFVRGYPPDRSYPYVWADTTFGESRQDEIDIIDAQTLEVVQKIVPIEGKRATHPEFTRDGLYVYIAVWGGDRVFVYDAHTFEKVAEVEAITPSGVSSVGIRVEEPGL